MVSGLYRAHAGLRNNKTSEKLDYVKISLAVLFFVSASLSGFFYYRLSQNRLFVEDINLKYQDLYDNYLTLLNTTSSIEDHYDELQGMYSTLRSEYSDLENRYSILLQEEAALRNEFNDIKNFVKSIVLEDNRIVNLTAGGSVKYSYDTIFAGYVAVNFTSSMDVYFWIGSSVTENEYYARFPPFPDTASNGTFTIPVCATVYVYIMNPNEESGAIVNLTIKYVY